MSGAIAGSHLAADCSPARISTVVSGRIPSSASMISPVSAPCSSFTATGRISVLNAPETVASWARRCDSAANASMSSRLIPCRSAEDLADLELRHELPVDHLEVLLGEGPEAARRVRCHRHPAHRLDPARDGDVVGAGEHALRGEVDRLLRRAALPVDRGGRHVLGQPGADPRVAGHVGRLLAHLGHAAADDVVDPLGIDPGALDELGQREAEEIGGVPPRQPSLALADRRAEGVDDDRFTWSHPSRLSDVRVRSLGRRTAPVCDDRGMTERAGAPAHTHRLSAVRRDGDRVTPLELFFDLVFVLAITQCSALMGHHPSWSGVGQGLLALAVLWWSWVGYAWLTSVVDPEEGSVRIVIFVAMAGQLVAALCVPQAFGAPRPHLRRSPTGWSASRTSRCS